MLSPPLKKNADLSLCGNLGLGTTTKICVGLTQSNKRSSFLIGPEEPAVTVAENCFTVQLSVMFVSTRSTFPVSLTTQRMRSLAQRKVIDRSKDTTSFLLVFLGQLCLQMLVPDFQPAIWKLGWRLREGVQWQFLPVSTTATVKAWETGGATVTPATYRTRKRFATILVQPSQMYAPPGLACGQALLELFFCSLGIGLFGCMAAPWGQQGRQAFRTNCTAQCLVVWLSRWTPAFVW